MAWLVGEGTTGTTGKLIEHSFNVLFMAIFAGYIFVVYLGFTYYDKWVALGGIGFLTPYFIMMLHAIPKLKGVYIEKYAMCHLDANVEGKVSAGKK